MAEPINLYVMPASHPCVAVETGLRLKRLPYRRTDLMFGLAPLLQMLRFGRRTVPAMTVGTQKVSGSRIILRALDGLAPDPPLVPADPGLRRAVDAVDEWGDTVFQEHVRWISILGVLSNPSAVPSYTAGYAVPPIPRWALGPATKALFTAEMRALGHPPRRVVEEYLPALPAHIDRIDALIADRVIGRDEPNVADLQLGASVRLLLCAEDLRGALDSRPAGRLARRLIPDYPGSLPAGSLPSPF